MVLAWAGFVFGICCGSLLNVVAYRIPRRESIMLPRSHCAACGRTLGVWELIPIASWLVLRGQCRTCRGSISVRYPIIELATAALFTITVMSVGHWSERIAWWLFWMLLVAAVGTDLTAMKVPNVLTYPGTLLVAVTAIMTGVSSWQKTLIGLVVSVALLFVLHWISGGRMGLGDAKLYASIGAMLGALYSVETLVFASISGSILGLSMQATGLMRKGEPIPFVPHIAIGVVITVVFGHQLTDWYVHHVIGW